VKKISGPQAGESGADDHNRLVGIERTAGGASNRGRGERKRSRGMLKKSSAIHILLSVRPLAIWDRGIMARENAKCQGHGCLAASVA
jgi:hypothetical protein